MHAKRDPQAKLDLQTKVVLWWWQVFGCLTCNMTGLVTKTACKRGVINYRVWLHSKEGARKQQLSAIKATR
jgi:hypothetical protein